MHATMHVAPDVQQKAGHINESWSQRFRLSPTGVMAGAANIEELTPMFALRRPVTTTLEVLSADGAAIQPASQAGTRSRRNSRARRQYHGRLLERCMRAIWPRRFGWLYLRSSNAIGTSSKMRIRVSVRAVEDVIEELPGVVEPAVVRAPLLPFGWID
jgi:hypothetical protein